VTWAVVCSIYAYVNTTKLVTRQPENIKLMFIARCFQLTSDLLFFCLLMAACPLPSAYTSCMCARSFSFSRLLLTKPAAFNNSNQAAIRPTSRRRSRRAVCPQSTASQQRLRLLASAASYYLLLLWRCIIVVISLLLCQPNLIRCNLQY
jgi:hypothetical protein